MILADTSIWIEHFRESNDDLFARLDQGEILIHPFVLGELMLGGLHRRTEIFGELRTLPAAPVATHEEVEQLIRNVPLSGRGIGYVDTALLASVRLHPEGRIWTADARLAAVARELSVGFGPA
jgi:predicted nucleic acid-binding protein